MPQNPYIPGAGYDNRRGGAYQGGGQVNPFTPPAGPYGSSNPGRDRKERELANRYGPHTGIPHPMTVRSGDEGYAPERGGSIIVNPKTGYQTGKVTDPTSIHYGAEYNTERHTYDPVRKLVVPVGRNEEGNLETKSRDSNSPQERMLRIQMQQQDAIKRQDAAADKARGIPARTPGVNPTDNLSMGRDGSGGFPPRVSNPQTMRDSQGNSLIPDEATGPSGPSPSSFREETIARYPKMSASLNKPVSEFTDIEEATEHAQNIYNKQRELMEQGLNSQNNAGVRALRQRLVELDQHVTNLKNKASQMPQGQRNRRSQLADDDPNKVWIIPEDTRPRLPDGSPSNNPNFATMLPEQYEPYEYEGMETYDWNNDGVLNQTEYARWKKLKAQQAAGQEPGGRTSSTHMTPSDMMPGYSIRGGRDTTGTQHRDSGGINPNAPRFHGDGTMHNDPGLQAPAPAYMDHTPPTDLTTPGGIDHADNPPGYDPPAFPGDQAGSVVSQQAQQLASSIANGEAIYRSILQNPQIPDAVKAKLAQLDANGNGYLSKKELRNADSILGDIGSVIDRGNIPRTGVLGRIAANRAERRNNRGR